MRVLSKVDEIRFCNMTSQDVVRHPLVQKGIRLVQKIVKAYEEYEKKEKHKEMRLSGGSRRKAGNMGGER